MDRRLLFPAVAITAWAQQPTPATAEVAEAEKALRARVEQFFQLEVDKKFRQAEALVAEDSKDDFYNRAKPDIKGFSIQEIKLLENNTRAQVTLKAKSVIRAPFLGAQVFEMPSISSWKIEDGQWVWYIDPELAGQSPFGRLTHPVTPSNGNAAPPPANFDPAKLVDQINLSSKSVVLSASNPVQTVTVSNNLSGPVTLELEPLKLQGISIELEKSDLKAGEKSEIRFRLTGEGKITGIVRLVAAPLNQIFEIQVSSN